MRSCWSGLIWAVLPWLLVTYTPVWALDRHANFHEITGQRPTAACQECHIQTPGVYLKSSSFGLIPDWSAYRQNGTALCVQCHEEAEDEHAVGGAVIDFPVPADLPLTADNTLMCMSCHFMHGGLRSERPWASVSFMDRMTDNVRMHKTYLLRRNNSNGELCLVCHESNEESPR